MTPSPASAQSQPAQPDVAQPHVPQPPPPRARPSLRRRLARLGAILLGVYLLYAAALWSLQGLLIFPRHVLALRPGPAPALPPGAEVIRLNTESGTVSEAILFPASRRPGDAEAPARRPLVIYLHGNAERVEDSFNNVRVRAWQRLGCAVLLPEYRGYGRSGGTPSQAALREDTLAFLQIALQRPDVDPAAVIFHGRSIGTGVALDVALRRAPAALVLDSTIGSVAEFAAGFGLPAMLVRHPFRNDLAVPRLNVPMLFLHGRDDVLAPPRRARELAASAKKGTFVELAGDHNTVPQNPPEYEEALRRFAEPILAPP